MIPIKYQIFFIRMKYLSITMEQMRTIYIHDVGFTICLWITAFKRNS